MERDFQSHVQPVVIQQLRWALIVWAALLLLFAVPDYIAMGPVRSFYYLLAYRIIIVAALAVLIFSITPDTRIFQISYFVAVVVVAGFTGFMLFFIYRPDIVNMIIIVIMIQLISLLIFVPIRFMVALCCAMYGVFITLVTRFVLGTSPANLVALLVLLMLPVVIGAGTTMRLGFAQRREFAHLTETKRINRELAEEMQKRVALEEKLKELASTDPLTGLYNRRQYEMLFQHEIGRSRRRDSPLSVGILDLDNFKLVNDTHGHTAGDAVLRCVADVCRRNLRAIDIVGRLGGEEFIILMPECDIDQANILGNRLLKMIESAVVDANTASIRITATIGITQLFPDDKGIEVIISRADDALYRGKRAGRNRVEINRC
jgi:diguanylate cyclase (GGDEF)-like protein